MQGGAVCDEGIGGEMRLWSPDLEDGEERVLIARFYDARDRWSEISSARFVLPPEVDSVSWEIVRRVCDGVERRGLLPQWIGGLR